MPARVLLFGGAVLDGPDGGRSLPVDRRGCLLAYLANDGGWVDRDRLALLFWPDTVEDGAKRNLRQLLLRTRRLELVPELTTRVDAVRWPIDSDVAQFRRAVAVGDHARATALYHGPFLEGFNLDDLAAAGAWIESERERLHAAFHGAALRHAAALAEGDALDEARALLARLFALDEFAEDVVVAYVGVLARAGRRDAAIDVYERFSRALRDDLGLEPLDATRELIEAVSRGEPLAGPIDMAVHDPAQLPRPLRSPRLVGREAERRVLRDVATPLVVVSGPPGVGKSRLLRESLPQAAGCGATEGLEQIPYHPLAKLVRERPDAAAGLDGYREDLARLVPEVAPEASPTPVDAATAKGRLAEALARFVAAVGAPLVIDDLQWADPATLETLVYLTSRGMRVVGAYRAGEAGEALEGMLAGFAARGELTRVALHDLGEESVRDLVADLMGRESGPQAFANWLWRRSGGNPMFLLESIKALFESGALWADGEAWHTDVDELTQDYTELDVPPVVSEVIVRRLSYLSREGQRVLRTVAVTRIADDLRFLSRVTGLSVPVVADALDECGKAGFLAAGEFQHDLLRQSVYANVDPQRKRMLHALAGEHLESRGRPELAAEQLWAAGERQRAREAWSNHVWALRTRGLLVDAVEVLRRAIARLSDGEDRAWLHLQLVDTLREADRLELAQQELHALELPGAASVALRWRHVLASAALQFQLGSVAETDRLLRANRHLAALVDDEPLEIDDVMLRARVAREQLRFAEAIELVTPLVERLRARRPDVRLVQFLTSLAVLNDDTGDFEAALALHTEALALARALGSRYYQVETATNLIVCLANLGRHDEAAALAESTLELGDYDNASTLRTNLAAIYFEAGRVEDALRHYRQLTQRPEPYLRLIALARSAECLATGGRAQATEEQEALIEAALDDLSHTDFPPVIARVAITTLRFGSPAQRERLLALKPDLAPEQFPSLYRDELSAAMAAAEA